MKIDMHCHVREGSIDSKVPIEEFIKKLQSKGIGGMLVTDHDTYNGYRHWKNTIKGRKYKDFVVLKGIEYDTLDAGHILIIMPQGVKMRLLELRGLPLSLLIDFVHHNGDVEEELSVVKNVVIQETCCKRSFLRGVFLASGSMSDPEKSYHFEIVCASMGKAQQIQKIMRCFALGAKIVSRKKSFVVYLKEGAQIVDVLNVMEAHQSLMELENIRILKDMRNTVNRKVNCETANINKTVSAAVKQIDDIRYIEETKGLDKLPEGLKDMALTRLTYPEASLKELGALLQNPVGKSGVNHRLRKLSEMAEEIRAKQGGTL